MKKLTTLFSKLNKFQKILLFTFLLVSAQGFYLVYYKVSDELVVKPGIADDPNLDAADKGQLILEEAVMQYMDDKGKAPQYLYELIPTYLKEVPVDPTTGDPYVYQVIDGLPNIITPSKRPKTVVEGAVQPKKIKETQQKVIMPQW